MRSQQSNYETHIKFRFLKNLISQPPGHLNTAVFIYIDKFLSLEMFNKGLEAARIAADSQKAGKVGQESLFDKLNCLKQSLKHSVGQLQSLASPFVLIFNRGV